VVYAKPPFAGPKQVLDYVGRYTHRVAISNNRILDIENGNVRFQWKNYRDHGRQKIMTLTADEFIRQFLLHVLPIRFQRTRYFGFPGNRYRKQRSLMAPETSSHLQVNCQVLPRQAFGLGCKNIILYQNIQQTGAHDEHVLAHVNIHICQRRKK
jgi:hypothetical protein